VDYVSTSTWTTDGTGRSGGPGRDRCDENQGLGKADAVFPGCENLGVKFDNEHPLLAFVNDLEEPEKPPDFLVTK